MSLVLAGYSTSAAVNSPVVEDREGEREGRVGREGGRE